MRLAISLTVLVLLTACSKMDSDATRVYQAAFAADATTSDVVALNGYRLERRKMFVVKNEMWRLHLAGPGAKKLVKKRWPDLRMGNPRVFLQGSQTPWFAPDKRVKYDTFFSYADPAVTVMVTKDSDEVFIAYDGL